MENVSNIFSNIRYYLLNSNYSNIDDLLKTEGATQEHYLTNHITHVICDNHDHAEYIDAKELFELTIVKSDWVLRSLETRTLLPTEGFSPDPTRLFFNINALNLMANIDENDLKKIKIMLNYYGGTCHDQIDQELITHAITTNYDKDYRQSHSRVKCVTPDWVIDCIQANCILDEIKYDPKYLKEPQTAPLDTIDNDTFTTENTQSKIQVDFSLARESPPSSSSKSKKSTKKDTTPARAPLDIDMNEIFQSVICEAVKKPVPICVELTSGIEETTHNTSFSFYNETYQVQENSQLLKFNNCLLGCVFYINSMNELYSGETLVQWQKTIEKFGGRVVEDYNSHRDTITHVLFSNRFHKLYEDAVNDKKRVITQFWLEDVLEDEKMKPPWRAYHYPAVYKQQNGPLKNHVLSLHGFRDKQKLILKTLIYLLNGKYTNYFTKTNSILISTSDPGEKLTKAREWNVPVVNGTWLMELYLGNVYALNENIEERYKNLDIDHFAFDKVFVQELMTPWSILIKLPFETINQENENNDDSLRLALKRPKSDKSEEVSPIKQFKVNDAITWCRPQSTIPIIMLTGVFQSQVLTYQKDIINLGGIISKQASQTTHLVMERVERTLKLLKCINYCEHIVSIDWLRDSKKEGKFLEPGKYVIKNEDFEKKYGCNLSESLERARSKKPVFHNLKFYLSPSVRPSFSELHDIIQSGGGQVTRSLPKMGQIDENSKNLVLISNLEDLNLVKPLIEKNISVYNEEFVLSGVLRQKIETNLNLLNDCV